MGKKFVGLDGLKHFWTKAKTWITGQITAEVTAKIAEIVANAPEDLDTLKEISDWITEHSNSAAEMNTQIIKNQDDIKLLQNKTEERCPVGTIMSGLYSSAPTGFLLCNGQEVSIASFPELYAVIGTLEGCQSENEGMFKVPDLRGRFLEGANGNLGNRIKAGLPEISGMFTFTGNDYSGAWGHGNGAFTKKMSGTKYFFSYKASTDYSVSGYDFNASKSNPIYGNSDTVQPPAVCVNYIIKY